VRRARRAAPRLPERGVLRGVESEETKSSPFPKTLAETVSRRSDPESPATLIAATRAPASSSLLAAAGTYFHAYVHALTTPPSLSAWLNGNVRVMDENAELDVSEHDSSRTAGAGVPEETTTARRFLGSCAPRDANSSPAPSNASASGAVPGAAAF
jgi:hypothetical protein